VEYAPARSTPSRSSLTVPHAIHALFIVLILILPATPQTPRSSFDDLSRRATAAREAERLEEAMSLYQKAVALRPSWAEGWFYLGTLHYDRNEFAPAAAAFRKVTALQPKSGTAFVMLGLCEFQLNQDENALRHLQKGKEIGVSNDPGLRNVVLFDEALLLQRKGAFEKAQEPLDQLCHDKVEREDLLQVLGMVQLRLRTTDRLATTPPGPDVIRRIGNAGCLAAQKRFDEARPEFETVAREFPQFPAVHYALGNFLLQVPDIPAAKESFEREIKNNPKDVLSRLKIAAALYRTDSAAGVPYAEQAVKLDPSVALGHYLLGLLLLDTDDFARAIPELETARKGLPDEPKLYFALGTAYSRAGRNADAARARTQFQKLQQKEANKSSQ